VAVVVGLLVAMAFGSGDFLGARASQQASTIAVLFVAQLAALAGAVVVAFAVSSPVTEHDLVYGAIAGSANVVGLGLLYHALSTGRMGTVAPVTAVVGASVPVAWGLLTGERPSGLALAGVGCAVVAGALLAREDTDDHGPDGRSAVLVAFAAGLGLGTSFIFFAKTSPDSGNWPVLWARLAAVVLVALAVLVLRRRGGMAFPQGDARRLSLGAGGLDVLATTLLLVALRRGLAVVVAPVASLAPGMTVVLAWRVQRERIGRAQAVGLGLAGVGLVLIAAG
jgi:drug/metabolite transporter (DMT)-like permease